MLPPRGCGSSIYVPNLKWECSFLTVVNSWKCEIEEPKKQKKKNLFWVRLWYISKWNFEEISYPEIASQEKCVFFLSYTYPPVIDRFLKYLVVPLFDFIMNVELANFQSKFRYCLVLWVWIVTVNYSSGQDCDINKVVWYIFINVSWFILGLRLESIFEK